MDAVPLFHELTQPFAHTVAELRSLHEATTAINHAVGRFNQQVDALGTRTGTAEQKIAGLETRAAGAENALTQERTAREGAVKELSEGAKTLAGLVAKNQERITALEHQVAEHWRGFQQGVEQMRQVEIAMTEHREQLEYFIAYVEHAAFEDSAYFREILERCGVTTAAQLRERQAVDLHAELRRDAAEPQHQHYRFVPAVRSQAVLEKIIELSRLAPAARRAAPRRPQS